MSQGSLFSSTQLIDVRPCSTFRCQTDSWTYPEYPNIQNISNIQQLASNLIWQWRSLRFSIDQRSSLWMCSFGPWIFHGFFPLPGSAAGICGGCSIAIIGWSDLPRKIKGKITSIYPTIHPSLHMSRDTIIYAHMYIYIYTYIDTFLRVNKVSYAPFNPSFWDNDIDGQPWHQRRSQSLSPLRSRSSFDVGEGRPAAALGRGGNTAGAPRKNGSMELKLAHPCF